MNARDLMLANAWAAMPYLTGRYLPVFEGKAVLVSLGHVPGAYLLCFANEADLRAVMRRAGVPITEARAIADGDHLLRTFAREVEGVPVKICAVTKIVANGGLRVLELKWN